MAARFVAVALSILAMALMLSACGGSGSSVDTPRDSTQAAFQNWLAAVDQSATQPAKVNGLPSIPLDSGTASRGASVVGAPVVKLGADHIDAYNFEDVETAVRLTAPHEGEGDGPPLAYAMYQIGGLAGMRPTMMGVECLPGFFEDNYFVGVADYTTMNWHFFGPYTMPEIEIDFRNDNHRYISEAGNFYFLVVTHNGMSALHSQTTLYFGEDGETRLPGAPNHLQASDGEIADAVGLVWTPGPGAEWYDVFRKNDGGADGNGAMNEWDKIAESLEPHFLDHNVQIGTVYLYKVCSRNQHGASGFSNVDSGFAGHQPPPPDGFRIHGWLRSAAGDNGHMTPYPNVGVTLLGLPQPLTINTNADGGYVFENLPAGNYIVVPFHHEIAFEPVYGKGEVGPNHPDIEINFTGRTTELPLARIWGFVWTFDGADAGMLGGFHPMNEVTLTIQPVNPEGEPFHVFTNQDGFYAAYENPIGGYLVTPSFDGFRFEPPVHDVYVNHEALTPMLNFVGVPDGGGGGDLCVIEGSITNADGGAFGEVLVNLIPSNNPNGVIGHGVTGADGHFRFGELQPGKYLVVPNHPHLMFDPRYIVVVLEPGQVGQANFIGVEHEAYHHLWGFTFNMEGEQANHFEPMGGVLIEAHRDGHPDIVFTAETNQDGFWQITELDSAAWIISAAKDGFVFEPGTYVQGIDGMSITPPGFIQGFTAFIP